MGGQGGRSGDYSGQWRSERRTPPCTHTVSVSVGGGVFTAFQKSVHCQAKCTSRLGFWPGVQHLPGMEKMDVTHPKGSLKSSCPIKTQSTVTAAPLPVP